MTMKPQQVENDVVDLEEDRATGSRDRNNRRCKSARKNKRKAQPPESGAADFVNSPYSRLVYGEHPGILVQNWVVQVVETRDELLVMAQLDHYYTVEETSSPCFPRAVQYDDDVFWIGLTYHELAHDIGLSKDAVQGAIHSLRLSGILVAGKIENSVYYRFSLSQIRRVLGPTTVLEEDLVRLDRLTRR
jgi:hypothetical protein